MTQEPEGGKEAAPRAGDRRGTERRRTDRRTPPPPWRSPPAFIGYGLAAGLLLFLLFGRGGGDERPDAGQVLTVPAQPSADPNLPAGAGSPTREAFGPAEFERLLAEGESSVGSMVRTELFCGSINQVNLREVDQINRSIAELADTGGRVPAAECRWGAEGRNQNFLLLIPPSMAERFASAPEVEQGFVRRRRVRAEVEWIGRSEALALRNAAVLRRM